MWSKLQTMLEMFRILRSGKNVGDVAVLKLTLFSHDEGPSLLAAPG